MKYLLILMASLSVIVYAAVNVNIWGDLDLFVFESTPTSGVSMYGIQLDVTIPSPGNISMGFGLEAHYVTADASFLEEDYTNSLGIYAVGVYRTPMTSVLDFLVISRGGVSVPSLDLSKMGYFTEVFTGVLYPFSKNVWIDVGLAMKSYAFGTPYVTFIPIKMGIGGEF